MVHAMDLLKLLLWSLFTVRAEIITELILERAGPVISKIFTGMNGFQTVSDNLSCENKAWKLLETIINSREGLSRNKISNSSE